MRRLWKIMAGIVTVVVGMIVVLLVLAKVLITPERVKALVVPLAESTLQRKVSLGEIRIGLFSGIELHDLAIAERNGADQLLTVDLARLRYQLLPLLAKRVIIDEVLLERPRVHLSRDAGGKLSIADLFAVVAGDSGRIAKGPAGGAESPVSLLVADVRVAGGEVTFTDRFVDTARPVRIALADLELKAVGFVLDGNLPLQLHGVLNGAPLAVNGTMKLKEKGGHFNVELQGLDALSLAPYFRGEIPGKLDALKVDLKADIDVTAKGLVASGALTGRDLALRLNVLPAAPIVNAKVRADFDFTTNPERDEVEIRHLSLDYNGLGMTTSGRLLDLSTRARADLTLSIPALELRQVMTALPPGLLGKALDLTPSGLLRAELRLAGDVAAPLSLVKQGTVLLEQVQGNVAGVRPAVNGRLILDGGTARIERLTINLGELEAAVAGEIENLFTSPVADLTVTVPRVELATALARIPPDMLKGLAGLTPSGHIEARARLAGSLAVPKGLLKNAGVVLDRVQVSVGGQRPELNGRLALAGDQLVSEGFTVSLAGNSAQLMVTARNLFGDPVVMVADVTARRFMLEPLLQGGGAAAGSGNATSKPDQVGPFDLPLVASGTLRLGETSWKGMAIRDFVAEYTLRDNQFTVTRMTGKVSGGTFNNTARVDLRQPGLSYAVNVMLQDVQVADILSALSPQATGTLLGAMTVQSSIKGSGTDWQVISRSLTGDAELMLSAGKLVSPSLVRGFAAFLQLPDISEIPFNDFHGKTRIVNGKAEIESTLISSRLKLFPKGAIGLDGSLNLAMDTRLSPELTARIDQRGNVTRYLLDADGWSQVPLLVTGTLQVPRFGLDPKGVQAQAARALQQELQRGLDNLRTKPKPVPPASDSVPPAESPESQPQEPRDAKPQSQPAPVSPGQRLLEDSLKRVLKY